jgi:hypothetical protein
MNERREALVVGINRYPLLRDGTTKKPQHLEKPAADAEAVAQILEKYGNFTVRRLPEVYSPEGKRGVDPNPPSHNLVQVPDLEKEIAHLFNPPGRIRPDTALLFFAGHGLRKEQGGVTEGFLATSDVNPAQGKWGVSLRWLRELLQKSPVQQQIIWLDCCHSGELLNILDEANPGKEGKAVDRCLIAACRGFEVSREQLQGEHGILTAALLQGLNPNADVDGWVSNNKLADFINKKMSAELQRPVFHNSGGTIILTDRTHGAQRQVDSKLKGKCPYKSLNYFTQEDAVFFYGRTELTDILIDRVRRENFTAVLGASGSGKSSVLRAGLLYQLKRGQKLSGSARWKYYDPFTPGEHPLQSLKKATGTDAQNFKQFIATLKTERVVLAIDQFEECFTMCQDKQEREQFFACLLQAVEQTNNKLRLVLAMRADFLGKCAEYAQLANKIDRHLVTVKPMTRKDIEQAIAKPGELVGLKVEQALVTKMTEDVVGSPGSLPLLEYTLTELWQQAQTGPNRHRLTLESYYHLGGIEKTLSKRANQVYNSLQDEEKPVAKRIFLELTQLGETSDTRRRVRKEDLVNQRHSLELLDRTIEQLVKAKLIVTTHESQSVNGKPGVILDIVHEALIRHWQELRQWVADNQVAWEIERKIEARAKDWERKGKTEDLGLLLQGATLIEAETYLKDYGNLGLLDGIAQEFIQVSQKVRDRLIQKELERKQRELKAVKTRNRILVGSLAVVSAVAIVAVVQWRDAERQKTIARLGESAALASNLVSAAPLEGLMRAIQATGESQSSLGQVLNPVQSSLLDAIDVARERNILRGHQDAVYSVALRPDGQRIVSGGADGTVRLWDSSGKAIGSPIKAHQGIVSSVALRPDGQRIVSGGEDGTVRLWDSSGKAIGSPFLGHQGDVSSVALGPDGLRIVSGGADGTVRLWQGSWERWLQIGCDRLLDHPVLVEPETNIDEESETIKFAQSARSTCQKLAWNPSENARFLVNQGRAIGQGGDFKGAMAKFQEARKLSPSITIPSEAEVGWWAAGGLVKNGEKLVKEGKVKEALAAYREAQTLKPTWKLPSESWNTLCRYGSLHGQAAEVMKACENAVTVAPENGTFRDSRGIARAMTGNTAGAIQDFQAFIKSTGSDEEKKQRQGWIDALKAGNNPFTQEEIKRLLPE